MNKLAAGALALALGLGAVAPAVAAEGNTGKTFVESAYNEQIKEVEKLFVKKEADRVALEKAKAALEAAMKEVKETKKAYDDAVKTEKEEASKTVAKLQEEYKAAKEAYEAKLKTFNETANDDKKTNDEKATAEKEYREAYEAYTKAQTALSKAVEAEKEGKPEAKLTPKAIAFSAYNQALIKEGKANTDVYKADRAYNGYDEEVKDVDKTISVHVDGSKAKFDKALSQLTEWAKGAGAILNLEGGKVVVKPAKPEVKKDNLAELKRAKSDAETAIKAVKLLKELSPEKIKKVEAKLNALVAKNEELVKKADAQIAKLEKKTAFIATAYADEAKEDDTDALIKELDSTTSEIKDLIKDTPEDKKANEEKKPEEKKPEDKKEEKTPSKKAGNNARTGIAGVAGVAGILAAASVAYAASKRD